MKNRICLDLASLEARISSNAMIVQITTRVIASTIGGKIIRIAKKIGSNIIDAIIRVFIKILFNGQL